MTMILALLFGFGLFFVLPAYWIYDMFANPIPGQPRARDMEDYQRDSYDTACDYAYGAFALSVFIVGYFLSFAWYD